MAVPKWLRPDWISVAVDVRVLGVILIALLAGWIPLPFAGQRLEHDQQVIVGKVIPGLTMRTWNGTNGLDQAATIASWMTTRMEAEYRMQGKRLNLDRSFHRCDCEIVAA